MSRLPKLTPRQPQPTITNPIVSVVNKKVTNIRSLHNNLASATSTSSLNINPLNKVARPISRRSKSVADINLGPRAAFNKRLPAATAPTEVLKRPVKRPGAPATLPPKPKIQRPNPPVIKKPIKSITAKPAPYDYKARFALLKESYDTLKQNHTELKQKYDEVTDEHEGLISRNVEQAEKLKDLQETYEKIRTSLSELQTVYSKLKTDADSNEIELRKCERKLVDYDNVKIELRDVVARLEIARHDLDEHRVCVHELKLQLCKLDVDKRKLHNDIQDLKGNIRVFCRVRPHLHEERHKLLYNLKFLDECSMELSKDRESIEPTGRIRLNKYEFTFDRVFSPGSGQEDVFSELAQLVQSALDGYNVSVFAYGQTGSGKTYTMEGTSTSTGMIPRAIDLIFASFKDLTQLGWCYEVKASFLEIYNENIVDLLQPNNVLPHDIKMTDSVGSNVYVTNLTIEDCSCAEDLKHFMKIAQKNRAVAATANNERSSRSHSVSKIVLTGVNSSRNETCSGSLNLIDLAGSERMSSNEATPRLTETKNINKSLANLSNVILALVQKQVHIPYRNSKLTHLLMPCLGGNSKTLMLVNVSPFEDCFNESLNSLRFAARVNQCKTGAIKRNKIMHTL